VKSFTTVQFRTLYGQLPEQVRRQARDAYRLFSANPSHPSLRFKRVHSRRPIYSARVSIDYRVIGVRDADEVYWFWIGSHADYDQILKRI